MVDIDERVVSMKFDSSDFEKNTKSTMSILDKLHEKLSFKDVADSDSLNAITDNVEKMANKAYTIVDRMIDKIKDNIANKLVNFLQENTLGQFKAGFDKYADMTTSVATLSSQGYEMKRITDQLERLNYFTDETSYNFTSMVSEIGKFTASGQSLEDATTAMMGIAEWAALSGKNANEASRAMYQLSQALGSGTMRLIDYKSIQNLNMDTIEFRKNAIEAAIAAGTLKDNLNGTFTSLIDNKTTFAIQNFAESLSGKWFNSKVMMETYKKYSDAVDEIRAIYEEGTYRVLGGEDQTINTTADAVKLVKENNDILYERFRKANAKLSNDDIDDYLKKWKKVEKVTNMTVKDYAEMHEISEEEAKTMMAAKEKGYAEYLKEYAEVFKETEQSAEEALEDWHTYVSTYGIKAFEAAQEAKTFRDAIESAKDAASTVWTTIYTEVFGNYEEAKELWTDLANALYEIFVNRLWDLEGIFKYWKDGYERDAEKQIKTLKEEYDKLTANGAPADVYGRQRVEEIKKEMAELQAQLDTGLLNGRRVLFQGLYAFGGGLKGALQNFRDAWNELFEENESAKRLFAFSERIRYDGFRFYKMMQELGETEFFSNIAQGIKNLFAPFKGALEVIKAVINSFLPAKQTTKDLLLTLSEAFKNFTEKLVPSQTTLQKIAKILRGVVSVIRLLAKAAYGLWTAIIKPILDVIFEVAGGILDLIMTILANLSDAFFGFEKTLGPMEALEVVGSTLRKVLEGLIDAIKSVGSAVWTIFGPAIKFIVNIIADLIRKVKSLFTGGNGNFFENLANGFKNTGERAKTAWKSVESFGDVFKRFREGKGIGNVIELLGELLDNLVTRIGRTILAIFGLEDVITDENGKITEAFSGLKSGLATVGTVLKWIYTNVIRPTLQVAFTGLANCIRDIGVAWQSGDVMQIMKILTQAFKTIGSFQLFKVLQALSRTFGSAGILKVLRNGAKALKSLSKWLGAKALNEVSSAIMKLVLSFGILLGILTAMSFLPTENIEKVSQMLIYAGIALGVMMVAMTTLSIVATKTRWGLVGIAGSMIAIVAATWTFIFVIDRIKTAVQRFQDEVEGFGGIVAAIAPIIAVLAGMLIVFKAAAKIGNSGGLLAFGAGIMALGVAVFAMTFALDKMVSFLQANKPGDILMAIAGILVIMTAVALASGLMLRIVGSSFVGIRKTSTAIAMALSIVTVALTTALIVIPLLDQMVQNADRFPQYVQALAIFCSTMVAISGSFALMTSRTKGGVHMLMAAITFRTFVGTIQNFILPMLETIKEMRLGEYIGGIIAVSILMISISVALRILMTGIGNIIESISKINAKSWIAIILSTGVVIAGVLLLAYFLNNTENQLSVSTILVALGVVLAVMLSFGIFAKMLIKQAGTGYAIGELAKVFKWMTLLITAIMTGLIGVMAVIKAMYGPKWGQGLATMGIFAGIILVTTGLILQMFGAWIKKMATFIKMLDTATLGKTVGLMVTIFGGIIAMMLVLTGIGILLGKVFDDVRDYLWPVLTIAGSTLGLLIIGLAAIVAFIKLIPTLAFNPQACILVIASLASIILLLITVSTLLLPAFDKYLGKADWEPLLALLGGIAMIITALGILVRFATVKSVISVILGLVGVLITLQLVAGVIPIVIRSFSAMKGITSEEVTNGLKAFLIPFGIFVALISVFAATGFGTAFLAAALEVSAAILIVSVALGALAVAIALIKELIEPGSTWLTMGFDMMEGAAEGIEEGGEDVYDAIDDVTTNSKKRFKRGVKENSPSKEFNKYGQWIDLGLAKGITKGEKNVVNAAGELAILTNEEFCDELGIASPSKVFYENGRFVVRGFINGLNDESNKNKKAGADMAEGFTEGMDNMMDGMKDKWSGLWSELGMDKDIKNAIENGTEGAGSVFANGLLDELTGAGEALTEAEEEELKNLLSMKETMPDNLFESGGYSARLIELEKKKKKSNQGLLEGLFSDGITGALNKLGGDTDIMETLKGFGETLGAGFTSLIDPDQSGSVFNKIRDTVGDGLEEIGNFFGIGGGGSEADDAGKSMGEATGTGLNNFLKGSDFQGTIRSTGQMIGQSISDGISDAIFGWVPGFLDIITGTRKAGEIRAKNNLNILAAEEKLRSSGDTEYLEIFKSMLTVSMDDQDQILLTTDQIIEMYNKYKTLREQGRQVNGLKLDDEWDINPWDTDDLAGYEFEFSDYDYENKIRFKQNFKNRTGIDLQGQELENAFNAAVQSQLDEALAYAELYKGMPGGGTANELFDNNGQWKMFVQAVQNGLYKPKEETKYSWEKDKTFTQSLQEKLEGTKYVQKRTPDELLTMYGDEITNRYEELQKNIENADQQTINTQKYKNWLAELQFYEETFGLKAQETAFENGEEAVNQNVAGMRKSLTKNEKEVYKIGSEIERIAQDGNNEQAGRKSPSRWWFEAAVYDMLGYENGLKAETPTMLNSLMKYFGIAQEMINDDSITPKVTPIFDGVNIDNGIAGVTRSFDGLTPAMQATVDSFQADTPNYNGSLAMLSQQVNALTNTVNSFMQMVEEGDIITVNVNAESDPNNIYELVVNTNRQKFRQTGKNNFAY